MAKIGFIGVGNMGAPMARNLMKAGHELKIFDVNSEFAQAVAKDGAIAVETAQDAVTEVDVVVSMLPSGQIVESLYIHQDKLLDSISSACLVIDCSTIAPENARNVAKAAVDKGIDMIDAPVSGGTAGAEAGTLTFICGGAQESFEKAKAILECMGKNIFLAGDSGAGQAAKICNNMLLAIHMAGTAEALALGVKNGLDPKVLSEIMLASSGRNWSLELYNPYPGVMEGVPASREYSGGFMVNLMKKDLGLALEASEQAQSPTPLGKAVSDFYQDLAEQGLGDKDFSIIQKLFES